MLVNSKLLLDIAKKRKFAIPAPDFIDLDSARVFVDVAQENNVPIILSFAQSHSQMISLEEAALIGKFLAEKCSVPIGLHLDHGEDFDFIKRAIELGFTSVMIDASMKSFEENIAITKKVVSFAHSNGVSVEAELGHVGAGENYENHDSCDSIYTSPADVVEFVSQTNIDSLAISIGTAHGVYKATPKINFERLHEIDQLTTIPLVLHGGSSSGDQNLEKCALNGIAKINIFTDIINNAFDEIQKTKPINYFELKKSANIGMQKMLDHYVKLFHTQPIDI